jgi:DNA-binding MarR family transcriptional regulator
MHIALHSMGLEGLSIAEIGFLVRLRQISQQVEYIKGHPALVSVPLTIEQIAEHTGLHINTVKKMRKALEQQGALKHEQAFHENGACIGSIYESGLTFTF